MTLTRQRPLAVAAVTATALVSLVACHGKSSSQGGGDDTSSPPSGGSSSSAGGGSGAAATTVDVKNFTFTPGTATVKTGGKVTWKFDDDTDHNVDIDSLKKKSPDLQGGKTYTLTFGKAGTYSYLCSIHQYMKGKVVVK